MHFGDAGEQGNMELCVCSFRCICSIIGLIPSWPPLGYLSDSVSPFGERKGKQTALEFLRDTIPLFHH